MSYKFSRVVRVFSLLVLLATLIPSYRPALAAAALPPVDMFQLPWEQGLAWVAIDGFDNGSDRHTGSPHNYLNGGAIDFAPRSTMFPGENTSNFWVAAAADGTVVELSKCHMKLAHANGWVTEYQHLANIQVQLGSVVTRNQKLAVIANATTQPVCPGSEPPDIPHLHFVLRPNMVGATFAGWQFKYNWFWNNTTFSKDGTTVGLFKPLLNVMPQPTPTPTPQATITPTLVATNTPDPSQATATATSGGSVTLTPDVQQTATQASIQTATAIAQQSATPTPVGQFTDTPTPAGQFTATPTPFGGLTITPTPTGPYVSTETSPSSIGIGETSIVAVKLHNVPATGFTSGEFTCTYDPALVQASNISITNLFGNDSVNVINGPQNGTFIVAIAGSNGSRAVTDGNVFGFELLALQSGQTTVSCSARVSQGDNILTPLPSLIAALTITSAPSTPTFTPTPTALSGGWLLFTNYTRGFQFQYPPEGQVVDGSSDDFARINLPIAPGTNLGEKYLEVITALDASVCQSPLATQSMLETSETVIINGLTFLKQTGGDAGAGNIYQWVAYSVEQGNVCVSLDFILHSHNPGAYSTPPPLFDYAAESAVFGQIVQTYAWLPQNLTPTPAYTATPGGFETPAPTATLVASLTPTPVPFGSLSGQVLASKPVTVNLYNEDSTLAGTVSANPDGTFAMTISPGTYTAVASAEGYLGAYASVTITSGNTTTLPTFALPAGDIDGNNIIDQFDALTIGMSYNTATPIEADLNSDGVINVLDLELLAQSYRQTGPVAWE